MSQLVSSYATDRYVLRLIRPDEDSLGMLLVGDSPSGSTFQGGATLRDFEQAVIAAQRAEENYWQSLVSIAQPEDRALLLSGWEHFRHYSGLPAPHPEDMNGNDQQTDSGRSDSGANT